MFEPMPALHLTLSPNQITNGLPYQILAFTITDPSGLLTPQDLATLKLPPTLDWQQGIVISGRGPIWLYGFLVHECHPARWVACYDTRLGAVVVATHTREIAIGQVISLKLSPSTTN